MKLGIFLLCLQVPLVLAQGTEDEGDTFCNIPPAKPMGATSLICTFPEDISLSKRDFSVVHINSTGKPILDCLWLEKKLECFNTSGYVFNMRVNNTLTIEIPRAFSNMTGLYYCKTSTSSRKDVQYCELEILMDITNSDQNTVPMAIGISLGLIGVGAIIALVIIFILRRRRKPTYHETPKEERPMLDRRTKRNQKQRREEVTKKFQEHLVNKTKEMYPNILDAFYFVPPVYLNKTNYTTQSVANQDVYIPDLPDQNEVRHDQAMQHVLHCLRHLAERGREQMFVLTQFQYKDYFNNVSRDYEEHCLPVPASLPQDAEDTGSFDFLIIHRRHGLMAGVVKVLRDNEKPEGDAGNAGDNKVVTEVSSALQRLKKTCSILTFVMSDQEPGLKIRQFLVLFNINKELNFLHSLTAHKGILENLKKSWPICFERLSDHNTHHGIDQASLIQFERLWERVATEKQDDFIMNDELYLTMIARFCGPATISVLSIPSESVSYQLPKTLDQAVSLTGELFERFTLYPGMTDLLDKPRLCLAGPPSTGKTKMLALAGRKWISEGHKLELIYTSPSGAVAANQLKKLLTGINPSLPQINCYLQESKLKSTIQSLQEEAKKRSVFALLDEVDFQKLKGKSLKSLPSKLSSNLHLWMAGCTTEHLDIKHPELQLHMLRDALGCPPSILRQAQEEYVSLLDHYTVSQYPAPTEGPPVKHFYHVGQEHSVEKQPSGCKCCANNIAGFLVQALRIGADDQNNTAISEETNKQSLKQASRLRYSDVLILFECHVDKDTPMVKSLQSSGIHVNVISHTNQTDIFEDDTNTTLVAKAGQLLGLKRKVVVFVKGGTETDDASVRWNRVRGFTSCTSQLVLVYTPQS